MGYVLAFLAYLLLLLRALFGGWVGNISALFHLLEDLIERWISNQRLPSRLGKTPEQSCVPVSDPAYKRPDPMIYDQYYLMSQGLAVTWDNPDIHIEQGGVPVPPHDLKPDTDYTVVARIWNTSTEAPVVGMPVQFTYLSFGIGTHQHAIGSTKVDLGVKGGPNQPAFASMLWHTPATPGHYCIQVLLEWLDDANPNNNLGQTNTNVVSMHSPADFSFQLRNGTRERQAYHFDVDTYTLPPPPSCDEWVPLPQPRPSAREVPGTIAVVPSQHMWGTHPLPTGWTVTFDPADPVLAPDEEISVQATVNAPDTFHGRQTVNVHAISGNGLAGGVTVEVERA